MILGSGLESQLEGYLFFTLQDYSDSGTSDSVTPDGQANWKRE